MSRGTDGGYGGGEEAVSAVVEARGAAVRGALAVAPVLAALVAFSAFVVVQLRLYGPEAVGAAPPPSGDSGGIAAPGSPLGALLATVLPALVIASLPASAAILCAQLQIRRRGYRSGWVKLAFAGAASALAGLFFSLALVSYLGLPPHIGGVFTGLLPSVALVAAFMASSPVAAPQAPRKGSQRRRAPGDGKTTRKRRKGSEIAEAGAGASAEADPRGSAGGSGSGPSTNATGRLRYTGAAAAGALPLMAAALVLLALEPGGYASTLAAAASWPALAVSLTLAERRAAGLDPTRVGQTLKSLF